jgi:hypothetical protein
MKRDGTVKCKFPKSFRYLGDLLSFLLFQRQGDHKAGSLAGF